MRRLQSDEIARERAPSHFLRLGSPKARLSDSTVEGVGRAYLRCIKPTCPTRQELPIEQPHKTTNKSHSPVFQFLPQQPVFPLSLLCLLPSFSLHFPFLPSHPSFLALIEVSLEPCFLTLPVFRIKRCLASHWNRQLRLLN